LFYLIDDEFVLLKKLRSCFLKRARSFFKKYSKPRSAAKKQALECPVIKDDSRSNGKIPPEYEPSKAESTKESLVHRWARMKEYYRVLDDEYSRQALKEARALMCG